MPRLMVEMRSGGESERSMREMLGALERAGAAPVKGFMPVPMSGAAGQPASFIVTVDVPDGEVTRKIEALPDVIQVYSDTQIAPFSPPGKP